MSDDWIVVHNAGTLEEADIVVAWLDDQGIKAMVKDRNVLGTLPGVGAVSHNQVEVCVGDTAEAEKALELLKKHAEEVARRHEMEDDEDDESDEDEE